jgi:hypothetical protein
MIEEYEEDNDLELLKDPALDWIREYLYELVFDNDYDYLCQDFSNLN